MGAGSSKAGAAYLQDTETTILKLNNMTPALTVLPPDVSQLVKLEVLELDGHQLKTLPASMHQLTSLNKLSVDPPPFLPP